MKGYTLTGIAIIGLMGVLLPLAQVTAIQPVMLIDGAPVITVLGKDAIPAIDRPEFMSVQEADPHFRDNEPVLGVRRGKVARAYSLWQLNHHEIVNDQVGDLSLAITW